MRWKALIVVMLGCATSALGQEPATQSTNMVDVTHQPTVNLDREALAADFDNLFQKGLARNHIPGAVLVVVYNGEVVYLQGYGLADVEANIPADPASTLFRIGSVSKLLTATGIMRLVEKGQLDLHAPINTYLKDFQLPDYEGTPITLWHLLTHTAGFDDRFLDIAKPSAAELEPTGEFLARRLPPVVTPPGSVMNYSNFGMTLAAHLVECVTGQPFSLYLDDALCTPLGIARGGFDQPLPPDMAARLAENYAHNGTRYVPSPWSEFASQIYPAGLYAATAEDMARFMQFHLDFGRSGDRRYMREATIKDMHRLQFRNHPDLIRGVGLGFHTRMHLDHPVVWHTGLTEHFTAQLVLAPEDNAGFFVAYNAATGGRFHNAAFKIFAQHFLRTGKNEQPDITTPDPLHENNLAFSGTYRQVRRVRSTMAKLAFLGDELIYAPDRQTGLMQWGSFRTPGSLVGDQWRPIEPGVYGAIRSPYPRRLAFRRNADGAVKYAFPETDSFSVVNAYERLSWYETTRFHVALHILCLIIFTTMLIRIARHMRKNRLTVPEESKAADAAAWGRRLGGSIVLINLAFLIGITIYINTGDLALFVLGVPAPLKALLALPILSLIGTIILTLLVAEEWRRRATRNFARIHTMITALACWAFLWSLSYWNLLGYWTGSGPGV